MKSLLILQTGKGTVRRGLGEGVAPVGWGRGGGRAVGHVIATKPCCWVANIGRCVSCTLSAYQIAVNIILVALVKANSGCKLAYVCHKTVQKQFETPDTRRSQQRQSVTESITCA